MNDDAPTHHRSGLSFWRDKAAQWWRESLPNNKDQFSALNTIVATLAIIITPICSFFIVERVVRDPKLEVKPTVEHYDVPNKTLISVRVALNNAGNVAVAIQDQDLDVIELSEVDKTLEAGTFVDPVSPKHKHQRTVWDGVVLDPGQSAEEQFDLLVSDSVCLIRVSYSASLSYGAYKFFYPVVEGKPPSLGKPLRVYSRNSVWPNDRIYQIRPCVTKEPRQR